jgi:hypothetical protein
MAAAPFMNCSLRLVLVAAVALASVIGNAAEKEAAKTNATPKIVMALPFVVAPGTNKVTIRGLLLTNATALRFPSNALTARILSQGKAVVPDKADVKKVGDTQIEVEIVLPENFPTGDILFGVSTPDGDTNTNLLHAIEGKGVFNEKEPNPGFRKANTIALPCLIRGMVQDANDVDVFRFEGRAGEKISAKTLSIRYGSILDPIITIFDANGHVLKTSDDAKDLDAELMVTLPRDGDYFLTINDAHERGGVTYAYAIQISAGR